jgi:phage-related protein (TIGR01555 family)
VSASARTDGFMGAISLAAGSQGRYGTIPGSFSPVDEVYATDGLAALIVDRLAEDALSRGFTVEVAGTDDADDTILNEIDRLDAIQHLTDGLRWARLHGAGAVLMLVDDGLTLDMPLDLGRIREVTDLLPYPASALTGSRERYLDPARANYGEPTFYTVRPRAGDPFDVHESRFLRISGDPLSYGFAHSDGLPWMGRSALGGCLPDLRRYRDALSLTRAILERKQQPVYQMEGLGKTFTDLPQAEAESIIAARLRMVDMTRGIFTTVAVDALDTYAVLDASVGGIDALLNGFRIALAASAGIPMPILFGEAVKGLGSTGEGELTTYHSRIRAVQERALRPALERLVTVLWAQKSLGVAEPKQWRVLFSPLWSPSDAEVAGVALTKAQARKAEAETLVIVTDGQLVTPDEGREFIRANWSDFEIEAGEFPEDLIPDPVVIPPIPKEPGNDGSEAQD